MRVFFTEISRKEKKCGGCNYKTNIFYGIADTKKDAKDSFDKEEGYGLGLCKCCIIEMLEEEKLELHIPEQ